MTLVTATPLATGASDAHGKSFLVELGARQVEDDLLGLGVDFSFEGAVGMEELVGDEGENRSAARGDAAAGDLNEEAGEELLNVLGGREFGGLSGEKIGGEVFEVAGSLRERRAEAEMARTESGLGQQTGKTATLAIGVVILAAHGIVLRRGGRDFQRETGVNGCGVH